MNKQLTVEDLLKEAEEHATSTRVAPVLVQLLSAPEPSLVKLAEETTSNFIKTAALGQLDIRTKDFEFTKTAAGLPWLSQLGRSFAGEGAKQAIGRVGKGAAIGAIGGALTNKDDRVGGAIKGGLLGGAIGGSYHALKNYSGAAIEGAGAAKWNRSADKLSKITKKTDLTPLETLEKEHKGLIDEHALASTRASRTAGSTAKAGDEAAGLHVRNIGNRIQRINEMQTQGLHTTNPGEYQRLVASTGRDLEAAGLKRSLLETGHQRTWYGKKTDNLKPIKLKTDVNNKLFAHKSNEFADKLNARATANKAALPGIEAKSDVVQGKIEHEIAKPDRISAAAKEHEGVLQPAVAEAGRVRSFKHRAKKHLDEGLTEAAISGKGILNPADRGKALYGIGLSNPTWTVPQQETHLDSLLKTLHIPKNSTPMHHTITPGISGYSTVTP